MNAQERNKDDVAYAFYKVAACAASTVMGLLLASNGTEGDYFLGFIGASLFAGGTVLTFYSIKELADTQADRAPTPHP